MRKIMSFQQMFEYKTGEKHNTKWSEFEATLAYYYYKTGGDLSKLGITNNDIFVTDYIGTNEDSIKMQAKNFQYLETGEGLVNASKAQKKVYNEFKNTSESQLRDWVITIMDDITDDKIKQNREMARYKNEELAKRKEEKKKEEESRVKRKYTKRTDDENIKTDDVVKRKYKIYINGENEDIVKDRFGKVIPKLQDIKSDTESFVQVGDILNHKKFGKGNIINVDGNIITIDLFDSDYGIKKFVFNPEHYNWNTNIFN